MNKIKYAILFLICIPPNVPGWIFILLLRVFFGKRLAWKMDALWCELAEKSWFRHKLYPGYDPTTGKAGWGGTTLGPHCGFVNYGELDTDVLTHETVHTEQYEVEAIQNFAFACLITGLGTAWWIGLGWWSLSGFASMLAGFVVAWLRNEPPYRGSILEESAYSLSGGCRVKR